jgi:hypothetical protein
VANDREKGALQRLEDTERALHACQRENQRLRDIKDRTESLYADNEDMRRSIQRHQSRVLEFQAALLQLGAKAHRAKWAFTDEELHDEAFDALDNLGDLALKLHKEI